MGLGGSTGWLKEDGGEAGSASRPDAYGEAVTACVRRKKPEPAASAKGDAQASRTGSALGRGGKMRRKASRIWWREEDDGGQRWQVADGGVRGMDKMASTLRGQLRNERDVELAADGGGSRRDAWGESRWRREQAVAR